jgi:DNA-binding NtrC family response regulator
MALLCGYHWPGNVRQLENALFRAVVLAETDTVGVAEFPQIAVQITGRECAEIAPGIADAQPDAEDHSPSTSVVVPVEGNRGAPPLVSPSENALDLLDENGEVRPLDAIEGDAIRFAISHYRGQMSEVARKLRIGRSTLYRKLDSLGLAASDPSGV